MHRRSAAAQTLSTPLLSASAADIAFLRALRNGHSTAWQDLLSCWSPRLYNYTLYNTYSEADAQQLLQSVFLLVTRTILQSSHTFNLTTLIVSALYRSVADYQEQWGMPTISINTPIANVAPIHVHFVGMLQEVAPLARHVLLLRYTVGLTPAELAAVTGHSIATLTEILHHTTSLLEPLSYE